MKDLYERAYEIACSIHNTHFPTDEQIWIQVDRLQERITDEAMNYYNQDGGN